MLPATLVRVPDGLLAAEGKGMEVSGTVELVVDESGAVEHVKLVAHGDYSEIQRIARAWRQAEFTPAMRAGQRVKVRISLPVWPTP